jgi:hypothetical protein
MAKSRYNPALCLKRPKKASVGIACIPAEIHSEHPVTMDPDNYRDISLLGTSDADDLHQH